jgi:YqfQ-like protein
LKGGLLVLGLLDKFKKKNQQPYPMNGPNSFNGYHQPYQNMQNPYGMRPNFEQRFSFPPQQHQPYQQNFYPSSQPFSQNHGYYQPPVAHQQSLNAHQQYVNQNKILQPVPFQNQPVIQSHNSSSFQQQSAQSQFPMTGQPPDRQDGEKTGFLSRMLGGDTSLTGIIGNMQRAVQTAQQVTPMIQQYGPVVKNLPSLYKIFKAVNTDDPQETKKNKKNKEIEVIDQTLSNETKIKKRRKVAANKDLEEAIIPEEIKINSTPKPKLFM